MFNSECNPITRQSKRTEQGWLLKQNKSFHYLIHNPLNVNKTGHGIGHSFIHQWKLSGFPIRLGLQCYTKLLKSFFVAAFT